MSVRGAESIEAQPVAAGRDTRIQVLIGADQAPNFALRRFTILPGGGMPRHTNVIEHEQYVLRGRARIGIGEEVFEVGPDNVVYIPAGVPHWYEAQGDEPFQFLCVVPTQPDTLTVLDQAPEGSRAGTGQPEPTPESS